MTGCSCASHAATTIPTAMTKRRRWSATQRVALFLKHDGVCHLCQGKISAGQAWEVSHDIPLELGGADDDENCKPAHFKCHRAHTAAVNVPNIVKAKRRQARDLGAKRSSNPLPGGKRSKWKRKMDGTVVPREPH